MAATYTGRLGDGLVARPVSADARDDGEVRGHVGGRLTGVAFGFRAEGDRVRGWVRRGGGPGVPLELAADAEHSLRGRIGGADAAVRLDEGRVVGVLAGQQLFSATWDEGRRALRGEAGPAPVVAAGHGRGALARGHRPATPVLLEIGAAGRPLLGALVLLLGLAP